MKHFRIFAAFLALALLASCGGKEEPVVSPTLSLSTENVTIPAAAANSIAINFVSTASWTASTNAAWVSLDKSSGEGKANNQYVVASVQENDGEERRGVVTISSGSLSVQFTIIQSAKEEEGILTIAEFKKKPVSSSEWYLLKGTIASIANYDYGNFYIADNTGYVYVYGLTQTQSATNDQSFINLGLKPGDEVTMMTHRSKYNDTDEAGGTIPAYYVRHKAGTYNGRREKSASAKWIELPATKADDGQDVLTHFFYTDRYKGQRSYSMYWDFTNLVATWCAYPLTADNSSSGSRTDAWALDPLLNEDEQPNICKNSYSVGNGGSYVRGHQVPSADRLFTRENLEVFFCTNIAPENSDHNTGIWNSLENQMRDVWRKKCDTLYVVTGVHIGNSKTYVLDNNQKKVTVPEAFYKALLAYSKDDGYRGYAAYYENRKYDKSTTLKNSCMSIDELEAKLGIDFFVNLPDDIETAVEAQNPATVEWWW